ncbi:MULTISPECIES: IS110 family transposase, partial [unclassified Micromonospora]|uniref:IS110 family transposase n=2 Tax=Micromonospora TaxID=1873 RepID=UPI003A86CDCD
MHDGFGVFIGLDAGKEGHHAVALNRHGKRLHDATLPNTEAGLRKLFDKLARHGRILAVVDQPASIGALPVAVARAYGHQVAYLPGLVMRRLADLHP